MRGRLALGTTALATVGCAVLMLPMIPACAQLGPCVARAAHIEDWQAAGRVLALLVGGVTLLAWLVRTLVLALKTRCLIQQLPTQEYPQELQEAVDRVDAGRVICVASDVPLAFCAGLLRPRIYVSCGLVDQLRPTELHAVLLHERHHSRRRDPLRFAVTAALKDVCFYLPVLGWMVGYQRENAELRADRAAIDGAGRRPLAGALWALGNATDAPAVAAFAGAAELRVAQVLGDPLPRRRPARSVLLASAIGLLSLAATTGCLAQLLLR